MSRNFINKKVSPETLRYIIENVFLPAKLPDEEDEDVTTKDSALLSEVSKAVTLFKVDLSQNPNVTHETTRAWDIISRMFDKMLATRTTNWLDKSNIGVQLKSMNVGDVLPIYVHYQNAGIIFRKRSSDELSFESFEISLPNEEVMATIGKIIVNYPANDRLLIPAIPELLSPLANAIAFLGSQTMSDAVPILVKAGFEHGNIRDTASPRWITEALAGVLRAMGQVDVRKEGTPAIRKRINDHVLLGPSKTVPWRRSAMWLLIRVALQSTLEELDVAGGEGYKAFQAYFMAYLLERCLGATIVPDDVIDAMNRKVARRMWKMKEWVDAEKNPFPTLRFVEKVVAKVSEVLADHWKQDREECVKSTPWIPPTQQEIEESLKLSLKTNRKYLESVVERTKKFANSDKDYDDTKTTGTLIAACSRRLNVDREELPTTINTTELDLGLMDFEAWVEKRLPAWSEDVYRSETDCEALSSIMEVYAQHGLTQYADSPERISIFWLTLMDLWIVLDRFVVNWCPIMERFSPEIPAGLLDPLLLPTKSYLERLDAVQSYIRRRHTESTRTSLFDDINSPHSFQNLYFDQSVEMQKEKAAIKKWTLEEKERTLQKMRDANAQYYGWKTEHRRISCEYSYETTKYGDERQLHDKNSCRKCELDRLMKKTTTPKFEEPLPTDELRANPIVFELNCPIPFGVWREATYQLLLRALSHSQDSDRDAYSLDSYSPTSRFYHAQPRSISIASWTAPIANSFLTRHHNLPANPSDVIVPHSGQFILSHEESWLETRGGSILRGLCTLRLDKPYAPLSLFIKDTTHTPNAVIASQVDCPVSMGLGEYIAFGQLRSGNEIQLRNIMRVLMSDSLSLNEAGVHSLIIQAIWQAGPQEQAQAWYRGAHEDLLDTKFGVEMLRVLNESMEKLGGNGREVFHLATLITLATRLHSLAQDLKVKDDCLSFLAAARRAASNWMTLVRNEAHDDPAKWRHRIALVAVVWRLTFDVDDNALLDLCNSPDNLEYLIFTKITIAADSTQYASLLSATRLLLRREKSLSYRLEPYIASALESSSRPLDGAACLVLNDHQPGTRWNPLASHSHRWWKHATENSLGRVCGSICIDILSGNMLVDGKPINRLPDSYIAHKTYQQLFGKSVSLWCYQSKRPGIEYEADYRPDQDSTSLPLGFSMVGTALIVRVLRKDAIEEYIPREQIQGDVPSIFLQFHHWYREALRAIEFRPLGSPWASDDCNWTLHLKQDSPSSALQGNLQKSISKGLQKAIDPHSLVFGRLHGAIEALESIALNMAAIVPPASIHQESLLNIMLPHHNMEFFLSRDHHLECRTHPGYLLDFNRDIGCLYGLENYIVLCDGSSSERVRRVVVPRGRLEAVKSVHRHPTIRVRVDDTKGCYTYDVDKVVGRLCGGGTVESEMFLVQLHAFTASHQPDPLTMRTGTEEALQYLENSSLLSHHEASNSWREHMKRIAAISPRRDYYPGGMKLMERVEWNKNLPSASQHPRFEQRIVSILSYWSDTYLQKVHLEHTVPLESPSGMVDLSRRAAIRDLRSTPSLSALAERHQDDEEHLTRDALQDPDSQLREAMAYQVSDCAIHLATGLPICSDLSQLAERWHCIKESQAWDWLSLSQWISGGLSVSDMWCTLYELCRKVPQERASSRYDLAMTLSMLAYKDSVPLNILGTLIAIARDRQFRGNEFDHAVGAKLEMNSGFVFDRAKVRRLVHSQEINFENSPESNLRGAPGSTHEERLHLREQSYQESLKEEVNQTVRELEGRWPDIPNRTVSAKRRIRNLDFYIRRVIRPLLEQWSRNKAFLDHLKLVCSRISPLEHRTDQPTMHDPQMPSVRIPRQDIKDVTLKILMDERNVKPRDVGGPVATLPSFAEQQPESAHESRMSKLCTFVESIKPVLQGPMEEPYLKDFSESVVALSAVPAALDAQIPSVETLLAFRDTQQTYCTLMHKRITHLLRPLSRSEELLEYCGLWPRVTTLTLLQRLSLLKRSHTPQAWIAAISQFANQIIAVQQSKRLYRYGTLKMTSEYNREILQSRQREPPGDPDWLLIEIDSDLCIRSNQVEIATSMLTPRGNRNTVNQLNMGEGKSSVIVPIVSATAANTRQLVRVVVLKPQSKLQLNLLRTRLSRLANRRVICLPFSRDLPVDRNTPGKIRKILRACLADGAIWLCQPEHLLSFKLLGLDLSMRAPDDPGIGEELIDCQLWTQKDTRDILDESDEILHTRHQLVYTVGEQRRFDAAPIRWKIAQEILDLLQNRLNNPPSSHFPPDIPDQFPNIRIKSNEGNKFFDHLADEIILEDALSSLRTASLPLNLKPAAQRLLKDRKATYDDHDIQSLQLHCDEHHENVLWQGLLLVRGLLAFGILPFALQKRWKVDYGLAPLQDNELRTDYNHGARRTHLAVPYRAKDSPSLRSNFAHPDVLILLTCLTYYYNGLTDSMVIQTFKELLKSDSPKLIYGKWTRKLPTQFRKLSSVNMDNDEMTLRSLYPSLGRSKHVIDFFLNQCIFPKEAKEFPFKMCTSGWDLAMKKTNPTTGFSGTNDSRFLLPDPIVQEDLPAQRHTNATVVAYLLQDENSTVVPHNNDLTSKEILDLIFGLQDRPTVLLDVGAQILDSSNEEFVKLWLSKYEENAPIKAAVFFDDDDNLCITERDGSVQAFADSPYSSRLGECVVYLDDPHTRGTDLRMPPCRAAVTLGPKLAKDKLMQGCMRMRKLGSGLHSLVFLAPDEVIGDVKRVIRSTNIAVKASDVILWAMKNTCRQLQESVDSRKNQRDEFEKREAAWKEIAKRPKNRQDIKRLFCQEEGRSLSQLYGIHNTDDVHANNNARAREEQEIELVHELEVEREVERPPAAEAAPHFVHQDLRDFVDTGFFSQTSSAFLDVEASLAETSLIFPTGGSRVFSNLRVTKDFHRTIKKSPPISKGSTDAFLRPLEWVVTSHVQRPPVLVALSPFEVNALLPVFRKSLKVRLRFFAARSSLTMQPLEDLARFTLPTHLPAKPIPADLSQQLNLYSGALYLRDRQSYENICATLRLHFGKVPQEITDLAIAQSKGFVKNSNGFVKETYIRIGLDLVGDGFEEDPVDFLRKLLHLRRHGRSFLPSHMGQILFERGLDESTTWC